jgi:hypothetical protein
MKITTITFSISLGLLAILNLPTLAAENQDWKIELQQRVRGFGVDKLFTQHHLPQTMKEFSYAKEAYNRAEEMLWDGQGVKALPYLIYAEHYMVPQSLEILRRVKSGVFEEIPEPVRAKIKQAFSHLKDKDKLYDMYKDCWNRNEERLRNSTKSSFLGSLTKLILGDNPSFPHTKPMQSISSEAFFGKQSKTSPCSTREGTAEDMVPLLPGELEKKKKE